MKHTYTLILLGLAALLSGCATTGDDRSDLQPIALELITKAAASEAYAGDKSGAAEVKAAAELVREGIQTGQLTLPAQVEESVNGLISELDVEPQTKVQIAAFADVMQRHYLARIDTGELLPGDTATIEQILTWAIEAADDTIRFGTVDNYGVPPVPEEVAERYELSDSGQTFLAKIIAFLLFEWLSSKTEVSPSYAAAEDASTTDAWGFAKSDPRSWWAKFVEYQLPEDEFYRSLIGYAISSENRARVKAEYNPQVKPGSLEPVAEQAQHLRALAAATDPDTGNVDHETFLALAP